MIKSDNIEINRIIIHKVLKKDVDDDHGQSEHSQNLYDFGVNELVTLKKRIITAFNKTKRFFKLEILRTDKESFFGNAKSIKNCDEKDFIKFSQNISDLLAISHDRRTIPSGLLLVMDGYFENNRHFVLVIKAELQEAFTIKEVGKKKLVELIEELFLSPAKDFYKIGFIVEDINKNSKYPNDSYSTYMYDDNFSSGKRDLAEYFYEKFLGLSSNKNDKLLTKNFFDDISNLINKKVLGFENQKGLRYALNSFYRENVTGIINPIKFAEENFDSDLLRIFQSDIGVNYPYSFTKDLSLVDRKLVRDKIILIEGLKIEGLLNQ